MYNYSFNSRQENIQIRDLVRELKELGLSFEQIGHIMFEERLAPEVLAIAFHLDLVLSADSPEEEVAIDALITQNPPALQDFLAGKKQALGSVIGSIKKQKPTLDARKLKELLFKKLNIAE